MRVDSSFESYHRFLGFDGFSDFCGNLDESVLFTNKTASITASLGHHTCFHKRNPRMTAGDERKDIHRPMKDVSSHELVYHLDLIPKLSLKNLIIHRLNGLPREPVKHDSKLSALRNSDL